MAVIPPAWLQNAGAVHTAQVERLMLAGLVDTSGLVAPGQLTVSPRGAGINMSVDVAPGICFIKGTQATYQGVYSLANDATLNLPIAASDTTNPRWDIVVARIRDSIYSGSTDSGTIEVITGTPAASPAVPSTPANSLKLGEVQVLANATSISTSRITNTPQYAALRIAGTPLICTSTTRPTTGLVNGFIIYETDTNVLAIWEGAWIDISPRVGSTLTNQVTAASGFSVYSSAVLKAGRTVQLLTTFVRTGGTIASNSTGNVTNVVCGTVGTGYRPALNSGWAPYSTGFITGGYVDTSGQCVLSSLPPNVSLTTGSAFSISATYIQGS